MNRLLLSAFSVTLLLSAASCADRLVVGRGPVRTEGRQVSGTYDKIDISAPVDVNIQVSPGAAPSIQINGYANVLKYLKMKVEDGTLKIYVPDMVNLQTGQNATATIILPSLSGVSVSGASDAHITGEVTGNQLDIEIAGSGEATVQSINVNELNVEIAGAASFSAASGNVNKASYDIAGSGEVDAFGLQTQETVIDVAGSGSAQVTAHKVLNTEISGSGNVAYKGHPTVTKDISGVGSIEDAN